MCGAAKLDANTARRQSMANFIPFALALTFALGAACGVQEEVTLSELEDGHLELIMVQARDGVELDAILWNSENGGNSLNLSVLTKATVNGATLEPQLQGSSFSRGPQWRTAISREQYTALGTDEMNLTLDDETASMGMTFGDMALRALSPSMRVAAPGDEISFSWSHPDDDYRSSTTARLFQGQTPQSGFFDLDYAAGVVTLRVPEDTAPGQYTLVVQLSGIYASDGPDVDTCDFPTCGTRLSATAEAMLEVLPAQ